MLNTPVLFLIFNRLDTAEQVLARIREAQPKQLFIAADGPRFEKAGEIEICKAVRDGVLKGIDWPCEVHTLFRENNLGSGKAISDAINWLFSHVETGIILEDDCLPDLTFFRFCNNALSFYKDVDEVMHISGCNLQCGIRRGKGGYYFSKMPATWGWATWSRAWKKYSYDFFHDSDETIVSVLSNSLNNEDDVNHYLSAFEKTKSYEIDAWDYQWLYTVFKNKGVCVTPQYNLIKNIGFNGQGTHTFFAPQWYKYLVNKPVKDFRFYPFKYVINEADAFYFDLTMGRSNPQIKLINFMYVWKMRFRKYILNS